MLRACPLVFEEPMCPLPLPVRPDEPRATRATLTAVLRLSGPAIAQSLLHFLVFLVDRAMLGRHGATSLASMQISGPLTWASTAVIGAIAVGTVALVGRAVGAKDAALAAAASRGSLLFAVGAGVVAGALGLVLLPHVGLLFPAAGPRVLEAAQGYLGVFLPVMPLFLVSLTCSAILAAAQDTRTPFLVAAGGNVLNVAVNWVLIFGNLGAPELGARGAAIGTAVAMGFQSTVLVAVLARPSTPGTFRNAGDVRAALARMIQIAIPSLGERVLQQAGFLGFVVMIGALGATAMAANQALVSIEAICFLSADGVGIAAAAIVAERLGARRPREAVLGASVATALSVAALSLCALAFVAVPSVLLGAFTSDEAIVAMGLPCMLVAAIAQPFMALAVVLSEALRGAGATRPPLLVMFASGLVVRLLSTWVFAFSLDLGLVGVWIGSTIDWVTRAILLAWVFMAGRWREARV